MMDSLKSRRNSLLTRVKDSQGHNLIFRRNMTTKLDICIVGGGLAGLASAISLANHATSNVNTITVLEKRDFTSQGATFGLAPNGQKALEEICPALLEELKEIGIWMPGGGYMLPWFRVRDGLLEHARKHTDVIRILEHTQVTAISTEEEDEGDKSPVTITALQTKNDNGDDDSTSTTLTFKADLVIGADGLHSSVRKLLDAPAATSSETLCWRGAIVNPPSDISHLLDIKLAKMHMVGQTAMGIFNFHAKLPNTLTWVVTSKNTSAKTPLDALLQEETQDFEGVDDVIKILNYAKPEELTFVTELCIVPLDQGWGGKGRVTLIGDAAHAIRPLSGLGGSLAFEDVALLTRQLMKSPKSNDVANTLRAFEAIRLPRCKAIQEDQTKKAESGYDHSDRKKLEWTPEYNEWVFAGPDASPHPPAEMYMS